VSRKPRDTLTLDKPISRYQSGDETKNEALLSRMFITDILNAVAEGNRFKVEDFLMKGFPVNLELNDNGWRLLHVAAQTGNVGIIKFLLVKGAFIDQTDNEEATALMIAVINNKQEAVNALIEAGADTTIPDVSGRSPAQAAMRLKYKGIYQALTGV